MEFRNTYEDPRRAAAYDELEHGGTYELVFATCHGSSRNTSRAGAPWISDVGRGARPGS